MSGIGQKTNLEYGGVPTSIVGQRLRPRRLERRREAEMQYPICLPLWGSWGLIWVPGL